MAEFPYLLQAGFEAGATNFDSAITDTDSKSAYMHYSDSVAKYGIVPYRGAYCWVINQGIGTNTTDCYQTQAAANVTADNYFSVGFALYLKGTVMADGNRTSIAFLCSGTTTKEVTLQLYYTTAGGLQLLLTETASTAVGTNPVCPISENAWHWIELYGHADAGGDNNGTAYLVLDGNLIGGVTGLDQGAFTDAYFGVDDVDAGHTAGIIAFDDIYISGINTSAVRLGYHAQTPYNVHISAPASTSYGEHLFVGPGTVSEVTMLTGASDRLDYIRLYDTDRAFTTGSYNLVAECNYATGSPVSGPLSFERGCYAVVTAAGASGARAMVKIDPAPPSGYSKAYCYGFPANLKRYASVRKELNGNM